MAESNGLSIPQLMEDLGDVTDWHGLGLNLGLKTSVLNEIERNIPAGSGCTKRRVCEVLDVWVKGKTGDPSWRDITAALIKMKEHNIADKMERKYSGTVAARTVTPEMSEAVVLAAENRQKIKGKFLQLQMLVSAKLHAIPINMQKFTFFVRGLFQCSDFLPASEEIDDIFQALTRNGLWDFLNYSPLQEIATAFGGNDEDIDRGLQEYRCALAGYLTGTKLADYIASKGTFSEEAFDETEPPIARKDKRYFKELSIKVRARIADKSLEYLVKLWDSVSGYLCLPSLTYLLDQIREGCIFATWLIAPISTPAIVRKIGNPQTATFFSTLGIIRMECDGFCLYEEEEPSVEDEAGEIVEHKQEQPTHDTQEQQKEASRDITEEVTELEPKQDSLSEEVTQHAKKGDEPLELDEIAHYMRQEEEHDELKMEIERLKEQICGLEHKLSQFQEEAQQQVQELATAKEKEITQLREQLFEVIDELTQAREIIVSMETPREGLRVGRPLEVEHDDEHKFREQSDVREKQLKKLGLSSDNPSLRVTSAASSSSAVHSFKVGDIVTVERPDEEPCHGEIKYLGDPFRTGQTIAGLEIKVEATLKTRAKSFTNFFRRQKKSTAIKAVFPGGGKGELNGVTYFDCADGYGLFLPVELLKRDDSFTLSPSKRAAVRSRLQNHPRLHRLVTGAYPSQRTTLPVPPVIYDNPDELSADQSNTESESTYPFPSPSPNHTDEGQNHQGAPQPSPHHHQSRYQSSPSFDSRERMMDMLPRLMHSEDCRIPHCSCHDAKRRFIQLCNEANPPPQCHSTDPSERRQKLYLPLKHSQKFAHHRLPPDVHVHHHLTTKSHVIHTPNGRVSPRIKRQCSYSVDLTPITESPMNFKADPLMKSPVYLADDPPQSSSGSDSPDGGSLSDTEAENQYYRHQFLLREISISADNIPALCVNDCPLTPTPLQDRTLAAIALSPIKARRSSWLHRSLLQEIREHKMLALDRKEPSRTSMTSTESEGSTTSSRHPAQDNAQQGAFGQDTEAEPPSPRPVPGMLSGMESGYDTEQYELPKMPALPHVRSFDQASPPHYQTSPPPSHVQETLC